MLGCKIEGETGGLSILRRLEDSDDAERRPCGISTGGNCPLVSGNNKVKGGSVHAATQHQQTGRGNVCRKGNGVGLRMFFRLKD